VLRDGEAEAPDFIQHAWDRGYRARQIIRENIAVGRTAGETLEHLARKLEAEDSSGSILPTRRYCSFVERLVWRAGFQEELPE
jgi:hypothetical protein